MGNYHTRTTVTVILSRKRLCCMQAQNESTVRLSSTTMLVVGLLVGAIIGGVTAYYLGHNIGVEEGQLSQMSQLPQHDRQLATQLALTFNQRIENTKSQLSALCQSIGQLCDRQTLSAMLTALDAAKIDDATIQKILTGS